MRALRARSPGLRIAERVIILGVDQLTAGRSFLDVGAYLNCGSIIGKRGYIRIGDNSEVGPYSVLWGQGGIEIGSDVHIAAHVSIAGHAARPISPDVEDPFTPLIIDINPVVIEDHVMIASGVVIGSGVRIGHHAVIGSGSFVNSDIPPYALAVGSPARVVRFSKEPATPG
jgi:acetyltransferase-like isoleucine patch superfamily enzyme